MLEQEAKGQEWEAGPGSWVPSGQSSEGRDQGLTPATGHTELVEEQETVVLGCLLPVQTDSTCSMWRDMGRLANNPQNTQSSRRVESPEVETRRVEAWAHGQGGRQSGYSQSRKLSPVVLARYTYLFRVCTCMCLEKVSTSSFLLHRQVL